MGALLFGLEAQFRATVRLRSSSFGATAYALRAERMRRHRREGWLAEPKPAGRRLVGGDRFELPTLSV
jgi:hypothetical protein